MGHTQLTGYSDSKSPQPLSSASGGPGEETVRLSINLNHIWSEEEIQERLGSRAAF